VGGLWRAVDVSESVTGRELGAGVATATPTTQPDIYQNTNISTIDDPTAIHAAIESKQPPALYVNSMIIFLWIGLVGMTAKVGIRLVMHFVPPGTSRLITILAACVVPTAIAIFLFFRSRTPKVGASDRRLPDGFREDARIRVVGPEQRVRAVLASVSKDAAFEPVIQRLVLGHAYEVAPTKSVNWFTGTTPPVQWRTDVGWTWQALVIGAAVASGLYFALWAAMGTWQRIDVFLIWALLGAALAAVSLAKPAFVRIAPGVLDIQESGWLGIGPLKTTRYDLRRARIYIDLKQGVARIEDNARTTRRTVCIRPAAMAWPRSPAWWACWKAVLEGAVTNAETPGLPEDELLG
jgi:hypothetical protein